MRKLLISLLLYKFIILVNFTKILYPNYNIKFHLNKFNKNCFNRKLENIIINKNQSFEINNTTKVITNIKKANNFKSNIIKNSFKKILVLIGFDSFIKKENDISFSIYFKKSNNIFHQKLSLNITIFFKNLTDRQENITKSVICFIDNYIKYQFLKYNCSLTLNENEKNNKIEQIQANYDSFLFNNKSYKINLSPISNRTINNIQNEENIVYKKFIEDEDYLYSLDNGSLFIDENNKIFYIFDLKLNPQNVNNYNKTKTINIEGNYIFPFKDELIDFNEAKVLCKIIFNNSNDTYNIQCYLNDSILTNINQAIGYGIDKNNKNKFIILNINEDLLNFKDNNNVFYTINFSKNSYGLSAKHIACIVVICVVVLIIISLLILY